MSIMFLSTKTIKPPTGEQTVCLPTITHCYLLMHCLKDGPVATVIMANVVANLMSKATAPHMGKLAISARVLIISKLFVVPRLQPRWRRALTEARSHSRTDVTFIECLVHFFFCLRFHEPMSLFLTVGMLD